MENEGDSDMFDQEMPFKKVDSFTCGFIGELGWHGRAIL